MTQLVPWNPRAVPTLWLDTDTGGVCQPGRAAPAIEPKPQLAAVLELARVTRADRVMLTGSRPPPGWLLTEVGRGWQHGAHHLDHETPVGRYTAAEGRRVEIRRAAEWFGAGAYTPAQGAAGWAALAAALAEAVPGMDRPLASPGATGREAWLRSRAFDQGQAVTPPQVSTEIAELLHSTSGQHRIELFPPPNPRAIVCGRGRRKEPTANELELIQQFASRLAGDELWLMDGRLMYAACVRELGTAPARMLTAKEAAELFNASPYARARYLVRVTVPTWWDNAGILPHKAGDDAHDGWEYPREPGRTFTTWADASEVWLAGYQFAWPTTFLAGIAFTPGRPLDTWAARLLRAFDRAGALPEGEAKLVRSGLRWMLLHAIGAWHSTGRTETTVTSGPMVRPAGPGWGAPTKDAAGAIWRRRVELDGRAAAMAHPEWSAQIWGRARARVLWAPTAVKGEWAGALTIDRHELVSIYGDAVMSTRAPRWAAEGYDDGRPGRLRVKGFLPDLAAAGGWPATAARRDKIMHAAEAKGPPTREGSG